METIKIEDPIINLNESSVAIENIGSEKETTLFDTVELVLNVMTVLNSSIVINLVKVPDIRAIFMS